MGFPWFANFPCENLEKDMFSPNCWIDISIRSNLLPVLFIFSLFTEFCLPYLSITERVVWISHCDRILSFSRWLFKFLFLYFDVMLHSYLHANLLKFGFTSFLPRAICLASQERWVGILVLWRKVSNRSNDFSLKRHSQMMATVQRESQKKYPYFRLFISWHCSHWPN